MVKCLKNNNKKKNEGIIIINDFDFIKPWSQSRQSKILVLVVVVVLVLLP